MEFLHQTRGGGLLIAALNWVQGLVHGACILLSSVNSEILIALDTTASYTVGALICSNSASVTGGLTVGAAANISGGLVIATGGLVVQNGGGASITGNSSITASPTAFYVSTTGVNLTGGMTATATITAATLSASSDGASITRGLTVLSGGAAITGDSSHTGALSVTGTVSEGPLRPNCERRPYDLCAVAFDRDHCLNGGKRRTVRHQLRFDETPDLHQRHGNWDP